MDCSLEVEPKNILLKPTIISYYALGEFQHIHHNLRVVHLLVCV